jgi:O-antigen ligase
VGLSARKSVSGSAIVGTAAVGSLGAGALATQAPLAGVGAGGLIVLTMMPWRALFVLLAGAAIFNQFRYDVATITLQPAHLIVVPFALSVFLSGSRDRPRWRWPESALVVFLGVQVVSSYLYSPRALKSIQVLGLLALGALTYLTTYWSVSNRRRLIFAARTVLIAGLISSALALLALASHNLLGTTWGIAIGASGTPAAGFAHEYNIQGSMSGSVAIAFLILLWQDNPLFSGRFAAIGFWVSFAALVASLTRGAWIAFGVALLVLLVLRRRAAPRRNRVGLIAWACLVLGLGVLIVLVVVASSSVENAIVTRGSNLVNTSTGSGQARLSENRIALTEYLRSPIIGLGTNSYGQRHEAPKKRPENAKGAFLGNLYTRTLHDGGVIALLALLAFMVAILWPSRTLRISRGDLAPVAWAFTFMYLMMAGAYVVTDASLQLWPWIVIGMARAARSQAARQFVVGQRAGEPADLDVGARPRRGVVSTAGLSPPPGLLPGRRSSW